MWQWLLCNKEVIEMIANIATAIIVGFAARGLYLNAKAVRLQRDSVQANLFNDISSRIRQLEDQWVDCDTNEKKKRWYERLFSAFEYFAFFANRDKLSTEMNQYYSSGIKTYVERLKWKNYSELLEEYKKRPKEQFSELRKYYKNEIKKDLPF